MYKERKENGRSECLVSLSYPSKREFKLFGTQGKSRFSRTSIEPVRSRLHAIYDAFAHGTAYIIRPTKLNDPACGLFGASPTS